MDASHPPHEIERLTGQHLGKTEIRATTTDASDTRSLYREAKPHFVDGVGEVQEPLGSTTSNSASWTLYWRSPVLMLWFLIFGIACALGHHFHYQALEGTRVASETSQQWMIRIGTGLAFLAKANLAAAVGVAYTQRLWVTVKKRALTLQSLDDAFSLTTDPLAFLSPKVLVGAKLLCVLAACVWCIPIVATITPATLTVRTDLSTSMSSLPVAVPAYSNEKSGIAWVNFEGVGRIQSASAAMNRLVAASSSSISVLPLVAPSPNSSFTMEFYAPSIRCETLSQAVAANTIRLDEPDKLRKAWNETMASSLNSPVSMGQLYTGKSMTVLDEYFIPSHVFVNTNGPTGSNYSCHLWNSSYTVDYVSQNGILSSEITELEHIDPQYINGSQVVVDYEPGQVAYWSFFKALSDIIVATIAYGSTCSLLGSDSSFFKSGIPACAEITSNEAGGCASVETSNFASIMSPWMCRAGSVPAAIEDLSHNVTLSLMSSALFSNATDVEVTVSSPQNYYSYNWHNLLYSYVVAVVVAIACVFVGLHAVVANGRSANSSFSSVLYATRNSDLDRLASSSGDLKASKLRYGVMRDDHGGAEHAAFGFKETTRLLKKGETF